ncbi:MAG: hypothetical protein QOH26_1223, partial [Actinomycetota bacterium]|nr:hypothetical protein [Actinomycetota bacterium]
MLRRRWFVTMLVLPALLLVGNTSSGVIPGPDSVAADSFKCPAGYVVAGAEERIRSGGPLQMAQEGLESPVVCVNAKHPEPMGEIYGKIGQEFAIQAAPTGTIPKGVYIKAIHARKRVQRQGQTAENSHRWKAYGNGPLRSADPEYGGVNGTGLVNLAGRITDYAYSGPKDKKNPNTLFASVAYGGVWKSTNQGKSWKSISKRLPTEVIGSVGYTPYKGTIVAVTGDGSFGRYSREGAGVWFSRNKGKTWRRSKGVPSDAFGFNVAFDAAHPRRVYVATGTGLFRSRNGAKSFKNVKLPTGDCAGKSNRAKGCLLANMVTDVVVQQPKGSTDVKGGAVLAAVGWRGGDRENPDGTVQSPNNGLYSSPNGRVGTFEKLGATGFTPQDRIGRIELGPAVGPDQDHNYVYAVVQDAVLLRGGTPGIDAPGGEEAPNLPTVLNGIYVSADFGASWTVMADASELQGPTTGSALAGTAQSGGYGPGIQSWYNEWIQPDPTKQVGGVPTRLLFGLEEVWMNEQTDTPQTGKSSFKVIGRYFSGSTCLFLTGTFPVCPTNREDAAVETTTTHPDQQASIFIPNPDPEQENSVRLIVGNDGGVYTQNAAEGDDFDNAHWGKGSQRGMRTLLPYDATIANDGTVWMGLQDNGTAKIQDVRKKGKVVSRKRQMMTLGGDGFFTAVEPNNSDIAYGEYTYGAMSATIDGGRTWTGMNPPGLDGTTAQFSNQFVMDPLNP